MFTCAIVVEINEFETQDDGKQAFIFGYMIRDLRELKALCDLFMKNGEYEGFLDKYYFNAGSRLITVENLRKHTRDMKFEFEQGNDKKEAIKVYNDETLLRQLSIWYPEYPFELIKGVKKKVQANS